MSCGSRALLCRVDVYIDCAADGGQVDIINRSPKQIQQDVVLVKVSARVFVRTHMCKK